MKRVAILFIICLLGTSLQVSGQSPDFTGLKVMINPGHGGHDSDDRGMPNGFWESEGNLTKGLWLRDLLEARGCEVIMSRVLNRTEDDLPLSQIAGMANDNNVDLFISIHSNAGTQSSNYPLTIFNGKSETPSIPEAKVWAQILWEQLITNEATFWTNTSPHYIGDLTLNPSWSYGYGVLYPLEVPGIISEGSFHDYKPEMDRLLNLDYRRQEAYNMLLAMVTYFNLPGSEPFGNISGIVRDSLLEKDNYSIENSPDGYMNVNGTVVELLETGDVYRVDSLNTGFYMFDSIPPGTYNLRFSATDYYTDTVTVAVTQHQFTYHNHWLKADKSMAPKVVSHLPGEGVILPCNDPVQVTFNMNMDSASVAEAFSIEPETGGTFHWDEDYLTVSFQPEIPYDVSTTYNVTIDTTAQHQWGVSLDSALSFTFTSGDRNRYQLARSFPASEQQQVNPYLQFRLFFDAPVNNSSLINAVHIIGNDQTRMGTKAASIYTIDGEGHYYFSPEEPLSWNEEYELEILGSVKDEDNIPLVDTLTIAFSTREEIPPLVILDEFDDPERWEIDFASSQGIDGNSFLYKWSKAFRSGDFSTLLRYQFLNEQATCVLKPMEKIALENTGSEIGVWLWGDLSGNTLEALFDNEVSMELSPISFAGWNYCSAEIPEGADSLVSLSISHADGGALTGDIYFDALSQPQATGVNPFTRNDPWRVYPNPLTGNTLHIDGPSTVETGYAIVSLHGQVVQKGTLEAGHTEINLVEETRNLPAFVLQVTQGSVLHTTLITHIKN